MNGLEKNGHCGKRDGCIEFQLVRQRVAVIEKTIADTKGCGCPELQLLATRTKAVEKSIKEFLGDQKWMRRLQFSTLAGVIVTLAIVILKS